MTHSLRTRMAARLLGPALLGLTAAGLALPAQAQTDAMTPIATPAQPTAIPLRTGKLPGNPAPEAWHRQYNSTFARNVTEATLTYVATGEDRTFRHQFDEVTWELRSAVINDEKGQPVFEQHGIEVPSTWSQTATNIVASKYFRGQLG